MMRVLDARVELYLARARDTKGVWAGGANTLVAVDLATGPTVMGSSD